MKYSKRLSFGATAIILITLYGACKKTSSNKTEGSGQLQVIVNPAFANRQNALQAVFTNAQQTMKVYYYGSFSADGKPGAIKHMTINKVQGDTSMYFDFDDSLRVSSLAVSYGSVKAKSLMSFDYRVPAKVTVSTYYYDFPSDSARLLDRYTANYIPLDSSYKMSGHTTYASIGSGLFTLLKIGGAWFAPPGNDLSKFIVSVGLGQAAIATCNLVIFAGITGIGCLIGNLPGCLVGGIIAEFVAIKPANASDATEILDAPATALPAPSVSLFSNTITLTNGAGNISQYEIISIKSDDSATYSFKFGGYWKHYLLGVQNSEGTIIVPGSLQGNIKIQVSIYNLTSGALIRQQYYDGSKMLVSEKNVRIVCSPRDINSTQRFPDGHIPAGDMSTVSGKSPMYVLYTKSK